MQWRQAPANSWQLKYSHGHLFDLADQTARYDAPPQSYRALVDILPVLVKHKQLPL